MSAPAPQTRSGAPNEPHSSKSRPFDRLLVRRAVASLSRHHTVAAAAPSESSRATRSDKTTEGKKRPQLVMMRPVPAVMDGGCTAGGL